LWGKVRYKIRPNFLRIPINAEILARQERFDKAISVLSEAQDDEHKVGQLLEIYYSWANSQDNEEKRQQIAETAIKIPIDSVIKRNIPVLIMLCKLSIIAKEKNFCDDLIKTIESINPNVDELGRIKKQYNEIWSKYPENVMQ